MDTWWVDRRLSCIWRHASEEFQCLCRYLHLHRLRRSRVRADVEHLWNYSGRCSNRWRRHQSSNCYRNSVLFIRAIPYYYLSLLFIIFLNCKSDTYAGGVTGKRKVFKRLWNEIRGDSYLMCIRRSEFHDRWWPTCGLAEKLRGFLVSWNKQLARRGWSKFVELSKFAERVSQQRWIRAIDHEVPCMQWQQLLSGSRTGKGNRCNFENVKSVIGQLGWSRRIRRAAAELIVRSHKGDEEENWVLNCNSLDQWWAINYSKT